MKRDNTKMFIHPAEYEGVDNIKVQTVAKSLGKIVLFRQAFGVKDESGEQVDNLFDVVSMELAMVDFDAEFRHIPDEEDLNHLFTLNVTHQDADDLEDAGLEKFLDGML